MCVTNEVLVVSVPMPQLFVVAYFLENRRIEYFCGAFLLRATAVVPLLGEREREKTVRERETERSA